VRLRDAVAMVSVGMALSACTGDGGAPPSQVPLRPSEAEASPFVRTCDTSVFGDLGRGWIEEAIVVGPVAFVGARRGYGSTVGGFKDLNEGKGMPFKLLVVVHDQEPATIRLEPGTNSVRLMYNPASFNANRLSEGNEAITFQPCGGGPQHTQFNGGMLLGTPACVTVIVEMAEERIGTASIPLGAPCPEPL
jgi:hypothetical protein